MSGAAGGEPRGGLRVTWLLGVLLVALLVRVGFEGTLLTDDGPLGSLGTHLLGDERAYDAFARESAAGTLDRERAFYQEPLYAWLVGRVYAVVAPEAVAEEAAAIPRAGVRWAIIVAQHLLGLVVVWGTATLGARVFGARAGLLAGLIVALSGPLVLHESMLLKASLSLVVLVAALHLWLDLLEGAGRGRAVGLGLLLGVGVLLRGNLYLLLALVVGSLLLRLPRRRPIQAGLVLTAALVAISPATIHNLRRGDLVLTTYQAGSNAAIGQPALPDPQLGIIYAPLRAGRGDARYEEQDAVALAEAAEGRALKGSEVSSWWWARVRERVQADPGVALVRVVEKLVHLFHGTEVPDVKDWAFFADGMPWLATPLSDMRWFGPWALLGVLVLPWRRRASTGRGLDPGLLVVLGGLAVVALSLALFYVMGRYRLTAVPCLAILAGAMLDLGWRGLVHGGALARVVVVLGALAPPALFAVLPLSSDVGGHHTSWANASTVERLLAELATDPAVAVHHRDRALAWADRAATLEPLFPTAARARLSACEARGPALDPLPRARDAAWRLLLLMEGIRTGADVVPTLRDPDEATVARRAVELLGRRSLQGMDDYTAALRASAARSLGSYLKPGTVPYLDDGQVLSLALGLSRLSLELEPEEGLAWVQQGLALKRMGRLDEAEAAYRRALEAGEDGVALYNNLGNVLLELGRADEAVEVLREAVARAPGDPRVARNLDRAREAAAADG